MTPAEKPEFAERLLKFDPRHARAFTNITCQLCNGRIHKGHKYRQTDTSREAGHESCIHQWVQSEIRKAPGTTDAA